jgi:leucyl-tRNA synthetase
LNTAISSMMELVNELYAFSETTPHGQPSKNPPAGAVLRPQTIAVMREALDALVAMMSPFAPHTAEELWEMLGHSDGLTRTKWPAFDAGVAKAEEVVVPVQINGKVRARLTVPAGTVDGELQKLVLADATVLTHIAGKTIRKIVIAKGPLVSIVV